MHRYNKLPCCKVEVSRQR